MGDHFVLLVDRLITESTLEAVIESRNRMMQANASTTGNDDNMNDEKSCSKVDYGDLSTPRKMGECRICHDEDSDSNMETPCLCCGSLKYAHRRCVQRWCNEKGDTTCEICHQQFKPGYTAPPPLLRLEHIPLNFRGNWGISRRELTDPRFITVVPADHNFLDHGYEEYPISSARSFLCCRSVVLIFMLLLVLRHTLPAMLSGSSGYVFPLFTLLLLRTVGVVLPILVVAKAVAACQRRENQMESEDSSDGETEHSAAESSQPQVQPEMQSYIIRVR